MHIFSAFSLARRRKVPQNRFIPTCMCQNPDQQRDKKSLVGTTSKVQRLKLNPTAEVALRLVKGDGKLIE
jgi:hypothetical protein